MFKQFRRRSVAMLLAVMMLFTMTPVQVFAEEEHDHEHDTQVVEVVDVPVVVTEEEAAPAAPKIISRYTEDFRATNSSIMRR